MASRKRNDGGAGPDKRAVRAWSEEDCQQSPVVWFMRLYVFQEKRDQAGIDHCLARLERLGYFVVPYPPEGGPDMGKGALVKGGRR